MADVRAARALFVNSGILGHRSVAALIRQVAAHLPLDSSHLDLSDGLSLTDRALRRVFSVRMAPIDGPLGNSDLRRWRQELHAGLLAARRIAALERTGGPFTLLHFHTQATAYASLRRMRRTPSIVSIDCTQRQASREAAPPIGRATYLPNVTHDGAVFRRAAAITATSRWAAADLAAVYPECAGKVHVLPYPVRGVLPASIVDQRRERWARDAGRRVRVLFMGGDFPRKGGPELVAAWLAGGFAARAELDLVTDWPLDPATLPPGVRVVRGVAPYSDGWTDLWRSADVFAMPSRHEAFGVVFQEAAAAGLPVVAARINAVPEIVADGKTGLLVPPGDARALVSTMQRLIDSADLRAALGRAALTEMSGATPAAYASRLRDIIAEAIGTPDVYAA